MGDLFTLISSRKNTAVALLDNIKLIAKKHGYSLTDVNDMADLGKNTIYSWKTKTPSIDNLKKVAKVLHTSTDYLLGNTDDQSHENNERSFIDISDDRNTYSYRGKLVPKEYLDIVRNLMDSDIRKGKDR